MVFGYLSGAPRVSTNETSVSSGARSHILGVINGLRENDIQVKEFIFGNVLNINFQTNDFYKPTKRKFYKRIIADLVRIVLNYVNRYKALKALGKVDFVYERLGAFQTLGISFKKKGIPWILETNSIIHEEASKDRKSIFFVRLCKYYEGFAYENASYIICITDELKKMLIENFEIDSNKIIVIPNGVDTVRFDPALYPKNESIKTVIGFVGNLVPWAGIDILIQAVSILEQSKKNSLEVHIIGDGQCRNEWQDLVNKRGLNDIFVFHGRKPWSEVPEYISRFDFGYSGQINTSSEGMYHSPLKIYEYLAMGKPVLASSYQDAANLIIEGKNGYTFTPGSYVELKKLIDEITSKNKNYNPDEIRTEIVNNHSWESRVKLMIHFLKPALYE
jgi:glycosyltransferase involved in cell wall biosynthesis